MKCIIENCNNEAIEDSNYCEFHKKKGGLQSLGRYRDNWIGGTIERSDESSGNKREKEYSDGEIEEDD